MLLIFTVYLFDEFVERVKRQFVTTEKQNCNMTDPVPIYRQNYLVGHITDLETDIWYQGGKWLPSENEYSHEFVKSLEKLSAIRKWDDVQNNLEKGIWVGVGINSPTHLVFSFTGERIDMRLTTSERPERW